MNINDALPSKYLKAADLAGKKPVVTVDHVAIEAVGKAQEMKPVVYFDGKEKGVVCNRTNAKVLTQLCGTTETDDWAGAQVQLFTIQTEFNGDIVDAIRFKPVRPPAPKPVAPPPGPPEIDTFNDDSDVPF